MTPPDLSVIIVSWNTRELLRGCLLSVVSCQLSVGSWQLAVGSCQSSVVSRESLLKTDNRELTTDNRELTTDNRELTTQLFVIDNASADGSAEMVRAEFPAAMLIANDENVGFARANNQGIRASQGRYVLLLNSDTIVTPAALAELVTFMDAHPRAGAVGPRLLRPDGAAQPYAFGGDPTIGYLLRRGINRLLLRRPLHDWATDAIQPVDWVSGACLMVRRAAIEQAGLLDEAIFMYFEDNDWCLRIRQAGWQVIYNPQVAITHIGGQSVARNPAARRAYRASLRYFYARHYGPAANLALRLFLPVYARLAA